jgi:predicted ArsR family transcriptional regulator
MSRNVPEAAVPLERDSFMRNLIRKLSGSLETMVGLEEASGFMSVVGRRIGLEINEDYREALDQPRLDREQVAQVLVDLKRRIQGDFYILEEHPDRIVLGNRACPFGDRVEDRPSMCMMTSNVFGVIAAENLGYAKVALEKTIARGDGECRVVVYLEPGDASDAAEGRTYFRSEAQ